MIMMVQTIITDMQQLRSHGPVGDDNDIMVLEPPRPSMSELTPAQQKQYLIQNAIANQKQMVAQKLQQVTMKQQQQQSLEEDNRPSMLELLDSAMEEHEVVVIEDDKPLTAEELELQRQMEQLKKSVSILGKLGDEPGRMPPQSPNKKKKKPKPPIHTNPLEAFKLAPSRPINKLPPDNRPYVGALNGSPMVKPNSAETRLDSNLGKMRKDPISSSSEKSKPAATKGISSLGPLPPPPPPPTLIDPNLDYLYNPSVVKTINQSLEPAKGEAGKETEKSKQLQVGYLPDTEFGEQPYSELLGDEENENKEKEKEQPAPLVPEKEAEVPVPPSPPSAPANAAPDPVVLKDRNESALSNVIEEAAVPAKKVEDTAHQKKALRKSLDERHRRRDSVGEKPPSRHPREQKEPSKSREVDENLRLEEQIAASRKFQSDMERKARETDMKERKAREMRRIRYERLEREGRYDLLKSERERWEKFEEERRKKFEREKMFFCREEILFFTPLEKSRRDRFEREMSHWIAKETVHMKKEVEEEIAAEKEAKAKGRTGVSIYSFCVSLNHF